MVAILIITNGRLAEELLTTSTLIVGRETSLKFFSIAPHSSEGDARERIHSILQDIDEGDGILLLTDMMGGSATNLALSFLETKKVEVIAGVNLSMVIAAQKALLKAETDLGRVAEDVTSQGQKSIVRASEVLEN